MKRNTKAALLSEETMMSSDDVIRTAHLSERRQRREMKGDVPQAAEIKSRPLKSRGTDERVLSFS